jgi:hypothetical protein
MLCRVVGFAIWFRPIVIHKMAKDAISYLFVPRRWLCLGAAAAHHQLWQLMLVPPKLLELLVV